MTRESINGHKFDTARRTSLREKNVEMTRPTPPATFLFLFQKRKTACRLFLTKEKSITIDRNGGEIDKKQTRQKFPVFFFCLFYFSYMADSFGWTFSTRSESIKTGSSITLVSFSFRVKHSKSSYKRRASFIGADFFDGGWLLEHVSRWYVTSLPD